MNRGKNVSIFYTLFIRGISHSHDEADSMSHSNLALCQNNPH